MDMRKKLLGAGHPDTITSMENLASAYHCQGRWNEAEQELEENGKSEDLSDLEDEQEEETKMIFELRENIQV
ncbi:hypothetical protein BYT27DRAFT_7248914 [Phlegmacium glaucopus]|nr:hypothetical protein BYT27DRAFT_7248914 [Phlegmacium glaucopus]